MLLDEPTNHLDDQAVSLLEEFVTSLPGVAVVASHDRAFLDAVCGAIVDLDPGGDSAFTGGYTEYLAEKRAARRRWQEAFEAQQDELDGLRRAAATTARAVAPHNRPPRDGDKFIHHFKGQNVARAVSRRVRDAERRIEVLERDRIPKPPAPFSFRGVLAPVRRTTGVVVAARDLRGRRPAARSPARRTRGRAAAGHRGERLGQVHAAQARGRASSSRRPAT